MASLSGTAIFSVVEICRKLGVPIRRYLADVLPGLADCSIHSLAELIPAACAAKMAKKPYPRLYHPVKHGGCPNGYDAEHP